MEKLNFNFPRSRIVSELNAIQLIPGLIREIKSKKPLIVTGKIITSTGVLAKLTGLLDEARIEYSVFNETKGNPSDTDVRNAVAFCNTNGNDLIIGFGGGSVMDTAKAAAMLKTNPRVFEDKTFENDPFPIITCPTTVGTGAEISDVAVFSDEDGRKTSLIHENISPDYAVMDPELLGTLSKKLAVSVGVDCMDHNLAYYVSKSAITISEAINETATCLLLEALPDFAEDRTNLEAAQKMHIASLMGQIVFSRPKLGICHAMAHALSQLFDVPHSVGVYIFLPYSLTHNRPYTERKLDKLGKLLQIQDGAQLDNSTEYFFSKIKNIYNITDELPRSLKDLGISPGDFPEIARIALTNRHCTVNPRPVIHQEIVQLLSDCYEGVFYSE